MEFTLMESARSGESPHQTGKIPTQAIAASVPVDCPESSQIVQAEKARRLKWGIFWTWLAVGAGFFLIATTVHGEPASSKTADENSTANRTPELDAKPGDAQPLEGDLFVQNFQQHLTELGVSLQELSDHTVKLDELISGESLDQLDAYVMAMAMHLPVVDRVVQTTKADLQTTGELFDPDAETYSALSALPAGLDASLRTWLGRRLVQSRFFDEAIPVLAEMDPAKSILPAEALFYRASAYQAMVQKKEAVKDLRDLLRLEDELPRRFQQTAKMMLADWKPYKEDSLDEVSRLMGDVRRRLSMGRGDEPTQEQEQKVIDKLTKLIEKMEEQQQQQQQQQKQQQSQGGKSGGSQGNQQGNPMQDSQIADASGNGDVDRKRIEDSDAWGNLPPAQRQQALQKMGQDMPSHYREVIEAYFRKLATDG